MRTIKNNVLLQILAQINFRTSDRIQQFLDVLNSQQINLQNLKQQSFYGIPDEPNGLRGLIWRMILGFLPPNASQWETHLQEQRQIYNIFKQEFLTIQEQDLVIWDIIQKDIRRTRKDMHFFFTPKDKQLTYHDILLGNIPIRQYSKPFITGFIDILEQIQDEYFKILMNDPNIEKHADVVARILYIYAKLNPGIQYVQGMNQLLAPIYYLFAKETNQSFVGYAEEDSFYCFTSVMSRVRDTFVKTLDSSESGLEGQLVRLGAVVERHDKDLSRMMLKINLSPYYFAIRWIILLLSQELQLPDVFRLWDCLFTFQDPLSFLHYICLVLLEKQKDVIKQGDFADSLESIQRQNIENIHEIILEA